jgi:hypothetical protein
MRNFFLFLVIGSLTTSMLVSSPAPLFPPCTNLCETRTEKGFLFHPGHHKNRKHRGHRGCRGHRGHRGHRGIQGNPGPTGPTPLIPITPSISLSFLGPEVDISPKNGSMPIIPFGELDVPPPVPVLEYVDPDPSDPTADRYIHILPGGAGLYLIAFSIYAQTSSYIDQPQEILIIQPQVNSGAGWVDTTPYSNFQTVFTAHSGPAPAFYSSCGSSTGMLYLQDNDKFRTVVLQATDLLSIGMDGSHLPSRDVALAMIKIETPS